MLTPKARAYCQTRQLGFVANSITVNVAFHIRMDDRCLHCTVSSYFNRILSTVAVTASNVRESMNPIASRRNGVLVRLVGQMETYFVKNYLSASRTSNVTISPNSSIFAHICDIITNDMTILTGSSFAFVALFSDRANRPLLFEERRKNYGYVISTE